MKTNIENTAHWQKLLTEKEDEIIHLRQQVQWLTQQFRLLQAGRFASSSEKTIGNVDQLSLFNEAEIFGAEETAEPELERITYARKRRRGKREIDFSNLPTERILYELPENERICTDCGNALHACGHGVVRRELTCIPVQYKVTEHVETAYSCRHCERTSDHVVMKKSEVPAGMIPGSGIVSPSLLAQILNNKYTLALPLYRQEQELRRIGINISRQTMSNWIITAHKRWFGDFFRLLQEELLSNEILHADETTLQVLHEDGRKASQRSYVWLYGTSGDTKRPVVLYDYQPSRAGECASNFLDGFSGKLHTDGYGAYHCKLPPEITVVGCWAHMRRKFTDALKSLPKNIGGRSPAQIGLNYCNKLFAMEADYSRQGISFDERYHIRLEKSRPITQEFFQWAKIEYQHNPAPKTVYGAALTYAFNQKSWLMNVFLDGRLELSNNRAERSIRPFAIGRKNWLFCNTPSGAEASATIYSIIETAKANSLKPFDYLKFLLERLPHGFNPEKCLPWGEDARAVCM